MNLELIIFGVLTFISMVVIYRNRERIKLEPILFFPLKKPVRVFGRMIYKFPIIYTLLIKTKIGISFTDKFIGRFRRISKFVMYGCIVIGVFSLIGISYYLVDYLITVLTTKPIEPVQAIKLVLPFKVKGAMYVPLVYWILSIITLAVLHEFGHALVARYFRIPIKSTGPAFFGILLPLIPAAFVEPDEKVLNNRPRKEKLAVFSAGSSFNIVSGFIFMIIFGLLSWASVGMVVNDGVEITGVYSENLRLTGIREGQIIDAVEVEMPNSLIKYDINKLEDVAIVLISHPPSTSIDIITREGKFYQEYNHKLEVNPRDVEKSMIGVELKQHTSLNPEKVGLYGKIPINIMLWIGGLFMWMSILSLGIGTFNLLPMIPLDGGLMVRAMVYKTKFEKPITYGITLLFLGMLGILIFV